ncbi:hypothetical protein A8C32_16035 [Flavivirga aquatica]|uniref:Glycosyl hydrolase family 88 n=1 Tax=Flavivirga aquatica TaxID=1849968 RepID=A0A1E5T9A8_9FLAO|nr:glycoside hydrolase family 88 protein [Flavivirga aquatica]OEK07970.1 hypothetical protein A8C32_16035 [Flavivirga aquatica]
MIKSKFTLLSLILISLFYNCAANKIPHTPLAKDIKAIAEKVANWQIETFEDMGKYRALPPLEKRKKWHHRNRYHDLDWTTATLYTGMYEFSKISDDKKYTKWLLDIGNRNDWKLFKRVYHADDHAVGQFYLNLYKDSKNETMIHPTQNRFDSIINSEKGQKFLWHWSDALFMSPPVWARLANITKNSKYLEFMDRQYHKTYNKLWDKEAQLFFRDKSYFDKTEKNGKHIFWSRGNGWVFGGLALIIPELPQNWEGKSFYIHLFKNIANTLKHIQREDGTWSGGLLGDEKDYPNIETSGTSFFIYGIAWGISNGILDKTSYEPVLFKAWERLSKCVNKEGMLGYVQPVGAAPGDSYKDYTEVYGSGAFLAASSEMYKYLIKYYPNKNK